MKDVMWGTILINSLENIHHIINIYNTQLTHKCPAISAKQGFNVIKININCRLEYPF